ncbi:MAG: DEAD/DEAH box helicase family protein [bacterium]
MVELRQYQQKALEEIRLKYSIGMKKGILAQSTGSGKTIIALKMVESALNKGKKVAFIVDRLTLLDQTCQVMCDNGIEFGIMQSNNPLYQPGLPFQICTSQTLGRRSVEPFDFCIYDESHILYRQILRLMSEWDDTYWIGLTATPFTKGLGRHWQFLVNGTTTTQLIREGFLSDYKIYGPSEPDLKGVRTSAGDYNKKDLAERVDTKKLIGDIIEHFFKLLKNEQTIVAAVDVPHAEHIADSFKKENIKADVIHCYQSDEEIQRKVKEFRNGEIQMLSSVDLISRGFDMPQAGGLIIARPTKSLNYHLQLIGRILRPFLGKEYAIILDHAGNTKRLGFPDDDFEMKLDDGKIRPKKKQEKKQALPKPCPKCFYMKQPRQAICPNCGFETKRTLKVIVEEGDLKELQRYRKNKTPIENKEKLYAKLLAGARVVGFKDGFAAHKYREHFGVWPAKKWEMDEQFYNWLKKQPRWKITKIVFGLVK